jgi:tetratricopeptide (TPR) repeat protein
MSSVPGRQTPVGGSARPTLDGSPALAEGWRLYGLGELDQARRLILPVSARSPDDAEAAYLLGMIFKAMGDPTSAIKAFAAAKQSVDLLPDRTRAEMLQRLAQANIDLLRTGHGPAGEGGR